MGRHTLSTTALAHQLISHLKPLSEMLPPNERRIVEKFFDIILQQRVAISEATDLMPLEAALVILLAEERRRSNLEVEQSYNRFDGVEKLIQLKKQVKTESMISTGVILVKLIPCNLRVMTL